MEENIFEIIEGTLDNFDAAFDKAVNQIIFTLKKDAKNYGEAMRNLLKFKMGLYNSRGINSKYTSLLDVVTRTMLDEMKSLQIKED